MATDARFEHFILQELWDAYDTARKGKRHTVDEHRFELNDMEDIINLRDSIVRRYYKPSRGVAFIIRDPVTREIVAAPFRDRVIHHFLFNVCAEWWDRRFLPDSYSCRKGKGTLYGQKRLARHIRQVTNNYTEQAFAVKLDIQGYFMSLNHELLYERILWGLDQQFYHSTRPDVENGIRCHPEDRSKLYDTLKYLWHEVIFDEPMQNIAIRGRRSDWKYLPKSKSLFAQPKGRGIVIGNLTSQLLSNIFLDQLDRFVTFDLGYKHYGRYVDDFFIIVPIAKKEQLLRDVAVIEKYLAAELKLTLHPKKQYRQTVDKGVPFIGTVVYPGFITPGRRARNNCFKAAYRLATNGEGDIEGFVARMGHMKHINSRKFLKKVFDTYGWEFDWLPEEEYQAQKAARLAAGKRKTGKNQQSSKPSDQLKMPAKAAEKPQKAAPKRKSHRTASKVQKPLQASLLERLEPK